MKCFSNILTGLCYFNLPNLPQLNTFYPDFIYFANSVPGIKHRHATSVFLINEFDLAIFAELYLSEPELIQLEFK